MAKNESALVAATAVVEVELERFEDATAAFSKISLNSAKNVERAGKALNDLADGEQRVVDGLQLLVKAIGSVRDRQLAQVEMSKVKAEEVRARSAIFRALEKELLALGEGASAVSAKLKNPGDASVDLEAEMGELADKAKRVAERATSEDFDDLSRVADGLRQQILAARSKLKLITKPTSSA